ncbi:MAG TPA: hypothetical protein VHO90_16400 [Bacteroidales bacterium]|nr:hypothetical protein [Bacteroidales bacterium]
MENEIVLKEFSNLKDDYRVVQRGNMVESINKLNQVFHYIDLSYTKQDIIFHGWTGFRSTDQMKGVLEGHFMDIYKKYKCKGALVESTKMSGSFNDANDWLANVFMPKLIAQGLTKVAVVLPHNIFAQMAVDEWDKKIGGFTSRNFGSLNEALAWLKS